MVDPEDFVIVTSGAIEKAGELIRLHYDNLLVTIDKPAGEFKTTADDLSDQLVKENLSESFPHLAVLSEEDKPEKMLREPFPREFVSFDPLDGTGHLLMKSGLFGIQAALIQNGLVVAAVIFQPILNRLFTAQREAGVFLNGRRIHATAERFSLRQSWVTFDFSYRDRREKIDQTLREIADKEGYSIVPGCVSFGMTTMMLNTCLRAGVFPDITHWDVAPGSLCLEEFGATVTTRTGAKPDWNKLYVDVVASVGGFHQELLDTINNPRKRRKAE